MKELPVIVAGKLSSAPKAAAGFNRVVRVRSLVEGFRRAGLKHSQTAIDHAADTIFDKQYEQLIREPKLVVQVFDVGEPVQEPPKK